MNTIATFALDTPTLADADALDAMAQESWRETFAHFYRADDLASFLAQSFGPEGWLRRDLTNPAVRWQIARDGDAIAGFVKLVPPNLPQATSRDTQVGQLYVLSGWQGTGVAQALMDWAIDTARGTGSPAIPLTVFEENHRAIRFYGKYGFVHVGDYDFPVGKQIDRDLVMRLAL
ncbi:MAG: GNAT family N-acetyltransferase [Alphaproteobacteria bacterium HGW-Alphaproteobacteria-16]|nr:MAG: GNAT family N-acetyltransferase [Alphaproteobacteria bacterium HGW-Alphaproteobacteria-16]